MACLLAGWSHAPAVSKSEATVQLEFGVKMALKGAWGEAAFRFDRAVKADGTHADAYNNLAVARENLGQYDAAREAYEKALELDPSNKKIRENYDLFMSFYKLHQRGAGER
ncbi:MAG TPA: tetratricopeptide repeat protein [Candidatus Polarisedimenticolia bacterium]|nr:tetratricopeptide repeat protein [Candidatus Polarisedimenticolia bacterium]